MAELPADQEGPPAADVAAPTGGGPGSDAGGVERGMRWVGVLTAGAAATPFLLHLAEDPTRLAEPRDALWLAAFAAFLAVFWWPGAESVGADCPRTQMPPLAVHAALALALIWLVPNPLFAVFRVIVAGGLGDALRPGAAVAGVALLTLAAAPPLVSRMGWRDGLVALGAFLGFQLFAVYALHTAGSERRAHRALAAVNRELRETRARLAETSRAAERLRISRDLHDVMGHHLTALSLNLEAARHAGGETADRHVETAHGLARRLLADVRQVVGRLRREEDGEGETGVDLADALGALGLGIDRPRLHVEVAPELRRLDDPERAAALVRSAQEMVTNAVRHSAADNVWLALERHDGGYSLVGRDDGQGALGLAIEMGNGLRGMGERLERLGGRVEVRSRPGDGFEVRAWLPAA